MKSGSCPTIEQLVELTRGGLSEPDSEAIFKHVEGCSECTKRLVQIPEDLQLLQAIVRASQQLSLTSDDRESIGCLIERLRRLPRTPTGAESSSHEYDFEPDLRHNSANETDTSVPNLDSADELLRSIQAHLSPPHSMSEVGRLGNYQVLGILGFGGMGVVLEAVDTQLARKVAIKALHPKIKDNPSSRVRFLREAKAVAAIEHDNIVPIYQVDEQNGLPFFVMPLLRGESLDQRIRRQPGLTIEEVLSIASQIAQGLSAAHKLQLFHRDIKPANIWLEERPAENAKEIGPQLRVKLLDFGLVQDAHSNEQSTSSEVIAGTPAFMSPEQAMSDEADARSDLFSLGCVLYRLCTGQLPFRGRTNVTRLLSIIEGTPKGLQEQNASVPPALEELVLQLLQREPANRPPSAEVVLERLRTIHSSLQAIAPAPVALGAFLTDRTETEVTQNSHSRWLGFCLSAAVVGVVSIVLIRGPFGQQGDRSLKNDSSSTNLDNDRSMSKTETARTMPGLVPSPESRDGYRRWQIETKLPRGEVFAVAWDGTGDNIACGSVHGFVRLLNTESSELVGIIPAHFGNVWAVDWSRDSRQVVTGGDDGKVLHFGSDGALLRTLGSHSGLVRTLAMSRDGLWVASGGSDSKVRLWRTDGRDGKTLTGHYSQIDSVAWHPSGKKLASAAWDQTIRIWNTESDVSQEIRLPNTNIQALAWSPLGDRLAAGGVDGLTRVFNEQGEEVARTTDDLSMVTTVAWSPDGTLATGDQNGRVHFWEADLQLIKAVDLGPDRINTLRWSNDGKRLAVVSDQIRFLNPKGETVGALELATSPLRSIEWSGADQIVTAGDDGLIRIWSKEGLQSHRISNPAKQSRVHWNASGDNLVSASWGQSIEVFDIQGNKLYAFPGHDPTAWNPISDTIAWAVGNEVRLGALGKTQHTLRGHTGNVQGLAWNADGTKLASGDGSGEIRIWNSDGSEAELIRSSAGAVIAWNPKKPVLAAAGFGEGDIHLWSDTGRLETNWKAQTKGILALTWSPDGTRLLSTSYDYSAMRLWKLNGLPTGVLGGTMSVASSASWSASGDRIATAHLDGALYCWDSQSLKILWTTQVLRDGNWARFSASGAMKSSDASIDDSRFVVIAENASGKTQMLLPSRWNVGKRLAEE